MVYNKINLTTKRKKMTEKLIRNKYVKQIPPNKLRYEKNVIKQYAFLDSKITEELDELRESVYSDIYEWADLFESISTMMELSEVTMAEINAARMEKNESLGGFTEFLILMDE